MADVTRSDETFVDAHGVRIHYSVWAPVDPASIVGIVQIAHGLGEHRLRYEYLAQQLVAAGYAVVADDHRGHGATGVEQYGGDRSRFGKLGPGGLPATIEAVRALTAIAVARFPGAPIVLLGHSWGSLMSQIIINSHSDDYAGVVLTGTAYRQPGWMNGGDLNARHRHLGPTPYEWLSSDPAIVTAANEDPLMFEANVLKLFGLVDGLRLFGRPSRHISHDLPVLIMVGSDDSLGGERSAHRLAESYLSRSKLTDVTAIVFPDMRHEIFNEVDRQEVINDLIAWLRSHEG